MYTYYYYCGIQRGVKAKKHQNNSNITNQSIALIHVQIFASMMMCNGHKRNLEAN